MIQRASGIVAIEGPAVASSAAPDAEPRRRRVEIDLRSGQIVAVGDPVGEGDLVLGEEQVIFPGFVDCHVHAREDASGQDAHKETFVSAGAAALHGGVVAFAEMPNNPVPPVDDASYRTKRELASACPVDVLLYAGIGHDTAPLSLPVPYKVYMGPSIGDLSFSDENSLRDALGRYRGCRVAFHAERPEVLERCRGASSHAARRPPEAEVEAIETALRLGEDYDLGVHICHLSTAEGLERIREARRRGQLLSCEVTPQHLYYDGDNATSFARPDWLRCNPPIRSRLDRIALLEGLRDCDIDFLATDHAPHLPAEKERGVSGMPHLDTFGAFTFWLLEEGFSPADICRVCAENPGRFAGGFLPGRYGKIEPGYCGSLTVLEPRPLTIRRGDLRTLARWSPFEGKTFAGRVSHTIIRGRIFRQA